MWTGQRGATRRFLAAAVLAFAIPAGSVVWLGSLLLRSDRELDRQRVEDRLEAASALVVGALDAKLAHVDQRLAAAATSPEAARQEVVGAFAVGPEEGAILVFDGDQTWSSAPLPYLPNEPLTREDDAAARFVDPERLEFAGDLAAAAAAYRVLSRAPGQQVRAGALARLARVARKLRRTELALDAYDSLAALHGVTALGRPADLVARLERIAVLGAAGRLAGLPALASSLHRDLIEGRWRLSRSQFEFYRARVEPWSRADDRATRAASATLAIAEAAIEASRAARDEGATGRRRWANAHGDGFLTWRASGDRVAALVATRGWVAQAWLRDVRRTTEGQRARVSLTTSEGTEWLDGTGPGPMLRRTAAETGLPFTVQVTSADPAADAATFAARRQLRGAMIGALALLMVGSGYIAARGVAREVAAARLQSDFVAAVSHEFRTPVTSVLQLSDLLDDGRVTDEPKRREYYRRIRRQAIRLQRLVENLLDFYRMEADAAEFRMAAVDPADLVREVVREFESDERGTGRRVDLVIEGQLPPVLGDREALARALWNLLDNAAKYSPAGARVVVETDGDAAAGVAIRVRDEGRGIPPDEQARIFDKFVRGARAHESGARGTGLGLAMVRHIVRAHRGEIRVDSRPGAGATFTIVLPAEAASA